MTEAASTPDSNNETIVPPAERPAEAGPVSGRERPRYSRWYLIYFLLAAFDILTVTGSLFLHHQLAEIYSHSLEVNKRWAAQLTSYVELEVLVSEANAPGNEVFASNDAQAETMRFEQAMSGLRAKLEQVRARTAEMEIAAGKAGGLELIGEVDRLTAEMASQSRELLVLYGAGRLAEAAQHMAIMDRVYAKINLIVNQLEARTQEYQRQALSDQVALAEQMQTIQYVIGALVLLMVVGVSVYGHALIRQMNRHERQRAEQLEALEASEYRFRELAEGSIQGIAVHRDGEPLFVNRAWSEMHGIEDPLDIAEIGSLIGFIAPEDRSAVRDIQYALQYGLGTSRRYECRGLRRDGSTFWMECMERVVSWQGALALQSTTIDITERKTAEGGLRSAILKAEQATNARDRFFAAASHDLRQPLHAISLYLPLLDKQLQTKKGRNMLAAVRNSTDAMRALLDSLLDISRLDAGVIEPEFAPTSLLEIFDQLGMEFAPQAAAKSLELRIVSADYWVTSDTALLERILRNLLTNAVRYTMHGRILLGARRSGNDLRIEVWDSGIGIPKETLNHIFEEFYQADNPERDRSRGLGLGLAIIDKLANLLNHRLDVRSWPDKGSVFSVTLPICEEPAIRIDAPLCRAAGADEFRSRFAIIVDDDTTVLQGAKVMLQEWGLDVIAVESISEALERLAGTDRTPDVILADLRLRNNETGLQAVQQIRGATMSPVPGIIVTGDTDPARIRQAAASDCILMHKPIEPDDLRVEMSRILGKNRSGSDEPGQVERASS